MRRIQNITVSADAPDISLALHKKAARAIGRAPWEITELRVVKKSIDARDKPHVKYVFTVDVAFGGESLPPLFAYAIPKKTAEPKFRPIIVGSGPAGLFAGLTLAEAGFRPIILERGQDVDARSRAVKNFWQTGTLDTESNVLFGEGGAGTFSDGKLTTGTKDPRHAYVFAELLEAGAPEEIAFDAKPHIGTDKLVGVVKNIREKIISFGGEVRFGTKFVGFTREDGVYHVLSETTPPLCGTPPQEGNLVTDALILAIGHSARDTFETLYYTGVVITPKPFSVGVRIEHKQSSVDLAQYGKQKTQLPAADYKLSAHLPNGRGVYTFCMCPGGAVVAAASEEGMAATNGMSYFSRALPNANAALLVSVTPEDFGNEPLAGFEFQRRLERAAFELGGQNYRAPAQLVGDFLLNRRSVNFGSVEPSYKPGVTPANLHEILPGFVAGSLREGLLAFDKKLRGFAASDAVLTGVETRSSSPVTLPRDGSSFCAVGFPGLYPCGEGAGHAGGIVSAAVDGIRCAEAVIKI